MCGIIYYKSFTGKSVNSLVLKHYLKQRNRGHEGFGFIGITGKSITICRATKEREMRYYLKKRQFSEIIFHHRLPTSTSNTIRTTHPIVVSHLLFRHRYYLVHNGIIQNETELKEKHEGMGIRYTTQQTGRYKGYWGNMEHRSEFNDSEALAHEVALILDGRQKSIEAQGDIAFICLETDINNNALRLHFGRNNGSPLEMKRDSQLMVIASENVSNQDITPHRLYTYDYSTRKITSRKVEFSDYVWFSLIYDTPNTFWERLEEIEIEIEEYEDKIRRIENAQTMASGRGDFIEYQRLESLKEQYEDRIQKLYEEYQFLEGMG
jgi:glucosamine 6-phosphate synthetase-like amidotransferase/phosphosugar isomerase protein